MKQRIALKKLTIAFVSLSTPLLALPDYLLSEQPSDIQLEDLPSSFESFAKGEGLASRPLGILLTPEETVGLLLFAYLPESDPFIRDTTAILRPRFYHRHSRRPNGRKLESTAIGGALELRTGWWRETVQLGVGAYTSQKLYGPPDRGGTGLLTPRQGGITALGEAWLKVRHEGWLAEVGRSSIDLPYINRNDSRMIPQTFELASLIFQPTEDFSIGFGHITRVKQRNSPDFISMSRAAGALDKPSRGVTTAGARWAPRENVELAVFNHYGWDTFNTTYFEAIWDWDDLHLPLSWNLGLQLTDQRSVGDEWVGRFQSQQVGFRAATRWECFSLTLATTLTSSDAGIRHPWGGSPSYASSMIADFDRAGEWSGRMILQTDLALLTKGLSSTASFGYGDTSEGLTPGQQEELDVTIDYRPPGAERLWFRIRQAWRSREGETTNDLRFIVNYEHTF